MKFCYIVHDTHFIVVRLILINYRPPLGYQVRKRVLPPGTTLITLDKDKKQFDQDSGNHQYVSALFVVITYFIVVIVPWCI